MATICLNMIVKNEASIIEETLNNILNHVPITTWLIADTGSTDNTAEVIQSFFKQKDIPGKLYHHTWKNFGHNRQLALDAAYGMADYVFFFDADDRFIGDTKIVDNPELTLDAYSFTMKNEVNSAYSYRRKLLIKNNQSWCWRGAVHEQLLNKKPVTISSIDNMVVISGRFGARNQDKNKCLNDAKMLEEEFFYTENKDLKQQDAYFIGQSYRDMDMFGDAFKWFNTALELHSEKTEQRRHILMNLAYCCRHMQQDEEMVKYLLLAYENSPDNAESLIHLARHFTNINNLEKAFYYARESLTLPIPDIMHTITIDFDLFNYERYNLLCHAALNLEEYEILYQGVKALLFQPESTKRNLETILYAFTLAGIQPYLRNEQPLIKEKMMNVIEELTGDNIQTYKLEVLNILKQ